MWKFSVQEDKRIALISCIAMWRCNLCAYTPYYPSVGHCIVYSCTGNSTTFYRIDESTSHFLFILTAHSGLVGAYKSSHIMKKVFLLCAFVLFGSRLSAQIIYKVTQPEKGVTISDEVNGEFSFLDDERNIEMLFSISETTIEFKVRNGNKERIMIEWQNARINGEEIAFSSDSATTFRDTKPNEVVVSNSFSVLRGLFAKHNFTIESTFNPITGVRSSGFTIREHGLSYNFLKKHNGKMSIIIPIRFADNTIKDYHFEIVGYFSLDGVQEGMPAKFLAVNYRGHYIYFFEFGTYQSKEKINKKQYKYNYRNGYIIVTGNKVTEVKSDNPY